MRGLIRVYPLKLDKNVRSVLILVLHSPRYLKAPHSLAAGCTASCTTDCTVVSNSFSRRDFVVRTSLLEYNSHERKGLMAC